MKKMLISAVLIFAPLFGAAAQGMGKDVTKLQCTDATTPIVDSYGMRDIPFVNDGISVEVDGYRVPADY